MHSFSPVDLAAVIACGWVIVKVLGPVARALARRIEGQPPASAEEPAVHQLRDELDELHERVDFLERALVSRQPPAERPRERTPV
jgi:predicted transcriptional regulator